MEFRDRSASCRVARERQGFLLGTGRDVGQTDRTRTGQRGAQAVLAVVMAALLLDAGARRVVPI